jgi:hypothetical protein
MAVPSRHITDHAPDQNIIAHHHILEDFVDSMAHMRAPVGKGRAIVKAEDRITTT